MKNLFKLGVCTLAMLFSVSAFAQTAADKIVGVYKVEEEGNQSKVRFTKCEDGTYQGQIIWLSQPNHPDGTRKMDVILMLSGRVIEVSDLQLKKAFLPILVTR